MNWAISTQFQDGNPSAVETCRERSDSINREKEDCPNVVGSPKQEPSDIQNNSAADEIEGGGPFIGEYGYSKSNKHPILIYRSRRDPTKCFTFCCRRYNVLGGSYACVQCTAAYRSGKDNQVQLETIAAGTLMF